MLGKRRSWSDSTGSRSTPSRPRWVSTSKRWSTEDLSWIFGMLGGRNLWGNVIRTLSRNEEGRSVYKCNAYCSLETILNKTYTQLWSKLWSTYLQMPKRNFKLKYYQDMLVSTGHTGRTTSRARTVWRGWLTARMHGDLPTAPVNCARCCTRNA